MLTLATALLIATGGLITCFTIARRLLGDTTQRGFLAGLIFGNTALTAANWLGDHLAAAAFTGAVAVASAAWLMAENRTAEESSPMSSTDHGTTGRTTP